MTIWQLDGWIDEVPQDYLPTFSFTDRLVDVELSIGKPILCGTLTKLFQVELFCHRSSNRWEKHDTLCYIVEIFTVSTQVAIQWYLVAEVI